MRVSLQRGDALIVVDVQVDFVSGTLAVPEAAGIVPILNRYIEAFRARGLPIVATRDWHHATHCSFVQQGGRWPPHCVAGTGGADFAPGLALDPAMLIVSRGTRRDHDACSAFDGTELDLTLRRSKVKRLFVGGLATDYCVLETVRDGMRLGYAVFLLADAIRAVNAHPDDGADAERVMVRAGAIAMCFEEIDVPEHSHG